MTADPGVSTKQRKAKEATDLPDLGSEYDLWTDSNGSPSRAIVIGAIDVFAEQGYHAATTRMVAARVGISSAGMYVHFPSKQSVLVEICVAAHSTTDQLLEAALAKPPTVDNLAAALGSFAAWHARNAKVARISQYELDALPKDARKRINRSRRKTQDRVLRALTDLIDAGLVVTDDVRSLTRGLISLCIDVCRWYDPNRSLTAADIGRIYTDLSRRLVQG